MSTTPATVAEQPVAPGSITGQRWVLRDGVQGFEGLQLAQRLGMAPVIGQILHSRGVGHGKRGLEEALAFLQPTFNQLPDPSHLMDMDIAVERLIAALDQNEKITIYGDYDVDGSCSSAILAKYFAALGIEAEIYIPDRIDEGYGPNVTAMQKLAEGGTEVLITVDCGATAFEPLQKAEELGMDVIITDHHQTEATYPPCVALINPNRLDETTECGMLCGAGVAFYLVLALNRALREMDYFTADKPEPKTAELLDLVAIASVCDMVPLVGVNRVLVHRGLQMLAKTQNVGVQALVQASGLDVAHQPYHAGFQLGPRLNAGGRIGKSDLGATLLSTTDKNTAQSIAMQLDTLNQERRELEQQVTEEAWNKAQAQLAEDDTPGPLVVAGKGWHPGVIGIVASRLKEKVYRPIFVVSIGEDGVCKGSGRSVTGLDLGRAVLQCKEHLMNGGGHAMAAGITVMESMLPNFVQALSENLAKQAKQQKLDEGVDVYQPQLKIDGQLSVAAVGDELMKNLNKLQPFGVGHKEPRFVFSGVTVQFAKTVGADQSHVKLTIAGADGTVLDGIAFKAMTSPLGKLLTNRHAGPISIVGTLKQEEWQGRKKISLHVEDAVAGKWSVD